MSLQTNRSWQARPVVALLVLLPLAVACGKGNGKADGGDEEDADGGVIVLPTSNCDNPTKPTAKQCTVTAQTSVLPKATANAGAVVSKGFAYVIGGTHTTSGTPGSTDVYVAAVDSSDTVGAWSTTTALPKGLSQPAVAASNGFIYVAGGGIPSSGKPAIQKSVYVGATDASGLVTSWTAGPDLTEARMGSAAVVVDGGLYVLGGYTDDGLAASVAASHVYRAPINSDGTLGAWAKMRSLPGGRSFFSALEHDGRIYVVGGSYPSSATACDPNRVLVGFLNDDGTIKNWGQTSAWADEVRAGGAAIVNNTLVVVGGTSTATSTSSSAVLAASINADGSVGAWKQIARLANKTTTLSVASTSTSVLAFGGDPTEIADLLATVTSIPVAGGADICSP